MHTRRVRPVGHTSHAIAALLVAAFTTTVAAGPVAPPPPAAPVPPATRVETVVDTVHGVAIADPYRWLEDFESDDVQAWIDAQNEYADAVLGAIPGRDAIDARLEVLFEIPAIGTLWSRGERLFYTRRDPDNEQMVLYVKDTFDAEPRVLIDPDALGGETPVGLDWWFPSHDGTLLAYGTSESGSEMSTLRVLNVDTLEHLSDEIPRTRAASLGWEPDGSGFYYTRFPMPGDVPDDELFHHRTIYHHALGDDVADDPLVYEHPEDIYAWPSLSYSDDGRFLLIYVYTGSSRNDILVKDLETGEGFVPVIAGVDARSYGPVIGTDMYLLTNLDAPNGQVFRVDLTRPDRGNWKLIIPEGPHSLRQVIGAGDHLLALFLENAHSVIREYSTDGELLRDVAVPDLCTVGDWTGDWGEDDVFINVSSFLIPPAVYRYSVERGTMTEYMTVDAPLDASPYVTEQVWYESKDGTPVSMFIVHRKDIALDGSNPTILTGYGGFASPIVPGFSRNWFFWMERGGVFATPNLRGGNEYGEDWHRGGMLANKQNTFDDFIAAAEWLIAKGYTTPEKLAVWGGSNGGLLVGAFITQRPDLAAAAICDVPLLDMVRYHRFYGAMIWAAEYGNPDVPEEFEYIYAYSPYQNIDETAPQPAVYFTAGESDMRVHPMHAMKMTARMQAIAAGRPNIDDEPAPPAPPRPILLRLERQAGHGLAARMSLIRERYVDNYAFLMSQLGMLE
jgi:prolyl oligopeptidase